LPEKHDANAGSRVLMAAVGEEAIFDNVDVISVHEPV
jgi:hypothetical protein